jgi:hypothetical protein
VIGFIDHLQNVTTRNYSAIAKSHTLQFTTAHTKFSQFLFTGCFLVTDPNNVLLLKSLPAGEYFTTDSQAGGHLTPISYSSD